MAPDPRTRPFLALSLPLLGPEEEQATTAVLRSGWLTTGAVSLRFEELLRERFSAEHAVALSSCTAALQLSLVALGVGPGDEVVVPAITYPATANVVLHQGARPVLVDVEPETLTMDPGAFAAALTPRTRAVLPVHLAGVPADLDAITAVADRHGVAVVEDAAHAIGATYGGRPVGGGTSRATCFSFHPTKIVTTVEGGALLTDDARLAASARLHRLHGVSSGAHERAGSAGMWEALVPGFKANMTDVQAAVGVAQLGRLDGFLATRRALAERYLERLVDVPAVRPLGDGGPGRVWHLFVVRVAEGTDRDALRQRLVERGIGTGIHFPALHEQPAFRHLSPGAGRLPVATDASARLLSLPLHPRMGLDDVDRVVDALADVTAQEEGAA